MTHPAGGWRSSLSVLACPRQELPLAPEALEVLVRGLEAAYGELEAEISASNPVCRRSGNCCHFAKFGHRLYASRAEALYFAFRHGVPDGPFSHDSCPFMRENSCTAREGRPLGCRVFFCDPSWKGRDSELSEKYIRRVGQLSDRLGISWDYRPFMEHLDLQREAAGGGG